MAGTAVARHDPEEAAGLDDGGDEHAADAGIEPVEDLDDGAVLSRTARDPAATRDPDRLGDVSRLRERGDRLGPPDAAVAQPQRAPPSRVEHPERAARSRDQEDGDSRERRDRRD